MHIYVFHPGDSVEARPVPVRTHALILSFPRAETAIQ